MVDNNTDIFKQNSENFGKYTVCKLNDVTISFSKFPNTFRKVTSCDYDLVLWC